jgi:Na+/H+ antiporter NhaD/arsenite permease-like protein
MIIGSVSHIPYADFALALAPVAACGLLITMALIGICFPGEFFHRARLEPPAQRPVLYHAPLVLKSVLVTVAMMALFFAGVSVAKVAIVGGALLLLTRSIKARKVYIEIDWPLLLMFVGLFIVVAGTEKAVLTPDLVAAVGRMHLESVPMLATVTAVLSNLVSNVPAVLVLQPFVAKLADPQRAWLVVAMASTLAGNLTLVGSVANLIVAERAERHGIAISFWGYLKVGAPLTLLTILLGVWWL